MSFLGRVVSLAGWRGRDRGGSYSTFTLRRSSTNRCPSSDWTHVVASASVESAGRRCSATAVTTPPSGRSITARGAHFSPTGGAVARRRMTSRSSPGPRLAVTACTRFSAGIIGDPGKSRRAESPQGGPDCIVETPAGEFRFTQTMVASARCRVMRPPPNRGASPRVSRSSTMTSASFGTETRPKPNANSTSRTPEFSDSPASGDTGSSCEALGGFEVSICSLRISAAQLANGRRRTVARKAVALRMAEDAISASADEASQLDLSADCSLRREVADAGHSFRSCIIRRAQRSGRRAACPTRSARECSKERSLS